MKIKRYKTIPKSVENWLGNRGVFIDDVHDPWYLKKGSKVVVVSGDKGTWLFIENLEFEHVDVYFMESTCAEIQTDFPLKDFKWEDKNIISIVTDLFDNSIMPELEKSSW
jgi:hypothetical protein